MTGEQTSGTTLHTTLHTSPGHTSPGHPSLAMSGMALSSMAMSNAVASLRSRVAERIEPGDGERGATMVEYALLLLLVFLVALVSIQLFGETIIALFETTNDTFENASARNAN